MLTHKIVIFVESRYPADRKVIRETAWEVLTETGLKSQAELGVSIVGDRKMTQLNKKYRNKDGPTPVLAFPQIESASFAEASRFPTPSDDVLRLGDVVISYPQARGLAKENSKLIDDVISGLVQHGVRKLCSI